jgi:hypothetical protein
MAVEERELTAARRLLGAARDGFAAAGDTGRAARVQRHLNRLDDVGRSPASVLPPEEQTAAPSKKPARCNREA